MLTTKEKGASPTKENAQINYLSIFTDGRSNQPRSVFNNKQKSQIVQSIKAIYKSNQQPLWLRHFEILERSRLSIRPIQPQPVSERMKRITRHQIFTRFFDLLQLSEKSRNRLIDAGMSERQIELTLVKDCPGIVQNLETCAKLVGEFGDISDLTGFYRTEFGNFRLDVSDWTRGDFICAERDGAGLIFAVRLFYSVNSHGFACLREKWGWRYDAHRVCEKRGVES